MTLTRGTRCWDGTTTTPFNQTSCTAVPMARSGSIYRSPTLTFAPGSHLDNFITGAGAYTLTITATDNAGNSSTQTRTFTVTGA